MCVLRSRVLVLSTEYLILEYGSSVRRTDSRQQTGLTITIYARRTTTTTCFGGAQSVGGRVWGLWFPRWCLAPCAGAPLRCCSGACFLAFDET